MQLETKTMEETVLSLKQIVFRRNTPGNLPHINNMNSLEFSGVLQPICCPLQSQVELHDKAKKGNELSLHKNYPLAYLIPQLPFST